jgi:hypothetical protein
LKGHSAEKERKYRRQGDQGTDLGTGRAAGEASRQEVPDLAEAEVRGAVARRRRGPWARVPPRAAHGDETVLGYAVNG